MNNEISYSIHDREWLELYFSLKRIEFTVTHNLILLVNQDLNDIKTERNS